VTESEPISSATARLTGSSTTPRAMLTQCRGSRALAVVPIDDGVRSSSMTRTRTEAHARRRPLWPRTSLFGTVFRDRPGRLRARNSRSCSPRRSSPMTRLGSIALPTCSTRSPHCSACTLDDYLDDREMAQRVRESVLRRTPTPALSSFPPAVSSLPSDHLGRVLVNRDARISIASIAVFSLLMHHVKN
jgi:hypothetical protein